MPSEMAPSSIVQPMVAQKEQIVAMQKSITNLITPTLTSMRNRRSKLHADLESELSALSAPTTVQCREILKGNAEGYTEHLHVAARVVLNACTSTDKTEDLSSRIAKLSATIASLEGALAKGWHEPVVDALMQFTTLMIKAMNDKTSFDDFVDSIPTSLLDAMSRSEQELDNEMFRSLVQYSMLRTGSRYLSTYPPLSRLANEIRYFQNQDKTNHAEVDKNMTIDAFVSLCRKAERAAIPWDDFVQTAVNSSSYKLLRGCQGNFDKESYSEIRRYFGTSKLFQDRILPASLSDFQSDVDSQAVKARLHAQTVAREK